ncbi:hypothetical protein BHE74_00032348 [Ensete ventricosum]|nr:hypothetical protein BHE74_00032348 [Ensete ventricosum]
MMSHLSPEILEDSIDHLMSHLSPEIPKDDVNHLMSYLSPKVWGVVSFNDSTRRGAILDAPSLVLHTLVVYP